jgi:C-terminal processing protease CtpA/Prc
MVDHVYPDSPAEEAGIKRGDMIMRVDGSYINANNYSSLFTSIQGNRKSSVELSIKRQTTQESFSCQLTKAEYDASPVAHRQVIEVEGTKIGYLA